MSLDFLRDNTKILAKAQKAKAQIDFTRFNSRVYSDSTIANATKQAHCITSHTNETILATKDNETRILSLLQMQIIQKPSIIAYIQKDAKQGLTKLQSALKENGYNVDLIKAWKISLKSTKYIPTFIAMVAKGYLSPYANKGTMLKKAHTQSDCVVALINNKQFEDSNFKKIGKFSGIYGVKLCIKAFNKQALSEVDLDYDAICQDSEIQSYINHNDLSEVKSNPIANLSNDEIAEGIKDGILQKAQVKASISTQRLYSINAILSKKAMI